MSNYLGKHLLSYNGPYYMYDPQVGARVPLTSPWSDSKPSVLDGGQAGSHHSGKEKERNPLFRHHGDTSPKDLSPHPPVKQGFQVYNRSSAAATAVSAKRASAGSDTLSPLPEKQGYFAIPKPVYAHNRCCDDASCARRRYSSDNGFPGMCVRRAHWAQNDARFKENPAFQKQPADTVMQHRALHFEPMAGRLQTMPAEFGPGGAALYGVVPNYQSYPSSLLPTLFDSSSELREQKYLRGFPYLHPSPYTYEHNASDVYQERSRIAKYGHVAQRPRFYCTQRDVEVEEQGQDHSSRTEEDVPAGPKRTTRCPPELYGSPHLLPFARTDASASPAWIPGLSLNYSAVPQFHSTADQNSTPLQEPDEALDEADDDSSGLCIDYSKFSVTHIYSDPTPHDDPTRPSTLEPPVPASRLSDLDVLSKTQINQRRGSSDGSDEMHSVIPKSLSTRKVHSPPVLAAQKAANGALPFTYSRFKVAPKRNRSSSSIEKRKGRKGLLTSSPKMKKVDTVVAKPSNGSPPMPVISSVFSLAPCNLQADEESQAGEVPPKPIKRVHCESRGDEDFSEERPSQTKEPLSCQTSPVQGVLNANDIKVEEVLPNQDVCERTTACPKADSNVAIKRDAEESDGDCGHVLGSKNNDPGTRGGPIVFADQKPAPDVFVPVKVGVQMDFPPVERTTTVHQMPVMLLPNFTTPPPPPPIRTMVDFKNIPPHFLKLTIYNVVVPDVNYSSFALPPGYQMSYNPAPPPGYQMSYNPAPPPEDKMSSNPAPPPEDQMSSSPAPPPPEDQKSSSPAPPPPEDQKSSRTASPPESLKSPRAAPPQEHRQSPHSTRPNAQSIPKPDPLIPGSKPFFDLHVSMYRLIKQAVYASSEEGLRSWLSQLDLAETPPPNAKLQRLSCLLGVEVRALWFNEKMKLVYQDLLQSLEEDIEQDRCPFPHVIRTGTVFLPMLVIKEQLFPMVQSHYIDQVLQEHRIELRPATLSEEKLLIQLHKGACSSRLRKLMSLKHFPDIYSDVTNVLYYCCVTKRLGLDCGVKEEPTEEVISTVTVADDHVVASPASPADSQSPPPAAHRKAMLNRKSRIKSSSRRTFLDDSLSDEEKVESGGGSCHSSTRGCGSKRTESTRADEIPSRSPSISTSDNSWMCPLAFEDLPPSPKDPDTPDPKCSGMVLKLRRLFCCTRKKARYQAVPDCSDSDASRGARKWRRAGGYLHATATLAPYSPPKRKRSPFVKVKRCPYLSTWRAGAKCRRRLALQQAGERLHYPDLVGKKIRHLYEEDDKSEVWYRGEVLRVHEAHSNPLKTIFEVRYDSEPEWRYFLELLIDYKKGWLKIEQ